MQIALNSPQKLALSAYASIVLIILFLHYPFGEYLATREVIVKHAQVECPKELSGQQAASISDEQLRNWYQQSKDCQDQTEQKLLSPLHWQSQESLIDWLGPLRNVLVTIAAVTVLSCVWVWAFKK